jgi:hypothetical protein
LTLTYTVTLTDSQGATDTKTVEVTITGTDHAAEVWIHTMGDGSPDGSPGGLWSTAQNWETRLVPKATDDVIIITDQLHGLTPSFPVTIDASTQAVANSVTMNDFDLKDPEHKKPELDIKSGGSLTIGGASPTEDPLPTDGTLTLSADSILHNLGTISVGTKAELLDQGTVLNTSVVLNAGTINLGQGGDFQGLSSITNTGTGVIDVKHGTLNVLVNIANSGHVTVDSGATLALGTDLVAGGGRGSITGGTVTINGTLELQGNNFLNNGTLVNNNQITATGTGNALDGETITNPGTIKADGGTLSIDAAVSFINGGTLEAINGGTLVLDSETVTSTGTIAVNATSTLDLKNAEISGVGILTNSGTMEATSGTSKISGTSSFTNSGTLEMIGAELDLINTTMTNAGSVIVDLSGGSGGILDLQNATINGGTLSTAASTDVIEATSGSNFIVGATTITNPGTIEANGGTLTIDSAVTFTNSGTLEAVNDSTLNLISTIVTDSATGVTIAGAGSHINLQNSSLLQHTVSTTVGGEIDTVSGNNKIDTSNGPDDVSGRVNNAGTLAVTDDSSLTLISAAYINNTGTIELNSTGHNTTLYIDQGFAGFDGSGNVTLSDNTHNIIAATSSGQQLTNLNNTISGAGEIGRGGLVLVNNGVIDANGQNALKLDPLTLTNTGTLEATNGAALLITGTTVTNFTGSVLNPVNGTIAATGTNLSGTSHSSVGLQDATINGGNISITLQGSVVATSGINTISGAASITNSAGTLEANGAELDIVNSTVTNTSAVINGNTFTGIVFVTGTNGTIKLENATIDGGAVDTTGVSDTVEATSGVNAIHNAATISNAGTIEANGATLTIDGAASFTNAGTLEANGGELDLIQQTVSNGGTLEAVNGGLLVLNNTTVNNTGGTVEAVDPGSSSISTVNLQGATINGGIVATISDGIINATGGTNAIDGATVNNAGTLEVTGGALTIDAASTVHNTGVLEANGGNLIIDTAFSGSAEIIGASLLELGADSASAYSSASISFAAAATGTLQLDHAKTFGGTVVGLDDNTLDLGDIAYGANVTTSYAGTTAGGILSIFVGGVDASNIHLSGDYTGVHWALTDDGSSKHGTDVTEVPGAIASGLDSHGNAS